MPLQAQSSRLGMIAGRKTQLENQAQGIRDPSLEEKFTAHQAWRDDPVANRMPQEEMQGYIGEWNDMSYEEKQDWATNNLAPGTPIGRSGAMPNYVSRNWESQYGPKARKEYESQFTNTVSEIDREYVPLQKEAIKREKHMLNRMALYNTFLGG